MLHAESVVHAGLLFLGFGFLLVLQINMWDSAWENRQAISMNLKSLQLHFHSSFLQQQLLLILEAKDTFFYVYVICAVKLYEQSALSCLSPFNKAVIGNWYKSNFTSVIRKSIHAVCATAGSKEWAGNKITELVTSRKTGSIDNSTQTWLFLCSPVIYLKKSAGQDGCCFNV